MATPVLNQYISMCVSRVGEGIPVLFGRVGQLFVVGGQVALCAPGLIEGGVGVIGMFC